VGLWSTYAYRWGLSEVSGYMLHYLLGIDRVVMQRFSLLLKNKLHGVGVEMKREVAHNGSDGRPLGLPQGRHLHLNSSTISGADIVVLQIAKEIDYETTSRDEPFDGGMNSFSTLC
jgi:hypothetical protein